MKNEIQAVTVILKEYPADRKVTVIKAIREITGLGLKEAKDLVEGVPSVVKQAVSKADAQAIKQRLQDIDAVVDVEVMNDTPKDPDHEAMRLQGEMSLVLAHAHATLDLLHTVVRTPWASWALQ